MAIDLTLSFPDKGADPISGIVVHRYQIRDALSELFELHAERDYKRTVERDSVLIVKRDEWLTVEHNKTDKIKWAYSMSAGSITLSCGPYKLFAWEVWVKSKTLVDVKAGTTITLTADAAIAATAPSIVVDGGTIVLQSGGSSITITKDGIKMVAPMIDLN